MRRALFVAALAAVGLVATAAVPVSATPPVPTHRGQTPNMTTPGLVLPQPSLVLPFRKSDAARAGGTNNISEGWYYGEERGITGSELHKSIDFDLPYDSPVYAMADGWAAFTYQSWLTTTEYQGKRVGFGLGLWLLTLHKLPGSDVYWWGKYAHLSKVQPGIKYLQPYVDSDGDWHEPDSGPDSLYVPDPQLALTFTPIKKGQLLGYVGDSGIEWGYRDQFDVATGTIAPRDRQAQPAWDDDTHLHLQFYRRLQGDEPEPGKPFNSTVVAVEPFGQYGTVRRWEGYSSYDGYPLGPGALWLTDRHGKPLYAAS